VEDLRAFPVLVFSHNRQHLSVGLWFRWAMFLPSHDYVGIELRSAVMEEYAK